MHRRARPLMHGELFGIAGKELKERVQDALAWAGLTDVATRPVFTYSGECNDGTIWRHSSFSNRASLCWTNGLVA